MNIDTLDIQFKSSGAEQVQSSLNNLVGSITRLNTSLNQMNGTGLSSFASGLNRLGNSVKGVTSIRSTSIDTIVNKFNKLSNIKSESLISSSKALETFSKSMQGLKLGENSLKSVKEVSDAMKTFGNKSFSNASENIKKLTVSLKEMMSSLSGVKNVNKGVIEMTNAMANLASQTKGLNALQFTSSVKNVGTESRKSSSGLNTFGNSLKDTNKHVKNSSNGMMELARTFGKFYASMFLVIRAFRSLGNAIKTSMDYTETYNYFNVVTDKMAKEFPEGFRQLGEDSADSYYMSFRDKMTGLFSKMTGFNIGENGELTSSLEKNLGADPNLLMNYQARIASITNSVGQMGQISTITSNALSMLAYDLSSLTNTDVETVMNNLASGLLGQARAMYAYGVDITNATLQQYALQYGIQKSVSEMTQMEKQQLRLIAILDQTRVAWTDQASTIMSVANQYRMLQANLHKVAQTIGNIFLPIVQKVLPYLNAIVIVIQRILQLLGFKIHGDNWLKNLQDGTSQGFGGALEDIEDMEDAIGGAGSGMGDVADNADEAQKNLDKAQKKAKKLKDYVLGIDELNIIKPQDDNDDDISKDIDALSNALKNPNKGSGGKGGGGGIDLSDAIEDLYMDYENAWLKALEDSANQVEEIVNKIWEALKRLYDIAEPTRQALFKLWNNGLKMLMDFNAKNLIDFYKNFLLPIGKWLLNDNAGLPRLFRILNDMLTKIDWRRLENSLHNLYVALQDVAKFTWNNLMGFLEYFLAPLATWTMSSAIPQLADILTNFIKKVDWNKITASLDKFWKALEPFAENVGQGLINFFNGLMNIGASFLNNVVPAVFNGLANVLNAFPVGLAEAIGEALGFLLTSFLALKGISKLMGTIATIKFFFTTLTDFYPAIGGLVKGIGKLNTVMYNLGSTLPAIKGALNGQQGALSALTLMYPKLTSAVVEFRNGLYLIKTGNFGQVFKNIDQSITSLRNNMTPVAKLATTVVAGFLEFKVVSSAMKGLVTDSQSVAKTIGEITVAIGLASTAMYVALGPIGLIAGAITGLVAVYKGAIDGQNEWLTSLVQNQEIEKYGDTIANLTQGIIEQNNALRENQEIRDNIVSTVGIAEAELAQDLADKYYELANKTNKTNAEKQLMLEYEQKLIELVPDLNGHIDEQTGLLDIQKNKVYELIQAEKERAMQQAYFDAVKESYSQLIEAEANAKEATDLLRNAERDLANDRAELATVNAKLAQIQAQENAGTFTNYEYKQKLETQQLKLNKAITEGEENVRLATEAVADSNEVLNQTQDRVGYFDQAFTDVSMTLAEAKASGDQFCSEFLRTGANGMPSEAMHSIMEGVQVTFENDSLVMKEKAMVESNEIVEAFSSGAYKNMPTDAYGKMLQNVKDKFEYESPVAESEKSATETVEAHAKAVEDNGQLVYDAYGNLADDSVDGYVDTFSKRAKDAEQPATKMVEGGLNAGATAQDSNSPSKKWAELGQFAVAGYNKGIKDFGGSTKAVITTWFTEFQDHLKTLVEGSGSTEGGEGGIFSGLLTGFQTACTSIIDYVTGEFVPLLTETFQTAFGGGMEMSIGGEGGGGIFGGLLTSFQASCQQILDYITTTFVPLLTETFATALGGGEMGMGGMGFGGGGQGEGGEGGQSGGLFGGLLDSFKLSCTSILDYVTNEFVPLLTETFTTAFGGGEDSEISLFDGLLLAFQNACQLILDYIPEFTTLLTEALATAMGGGEGGEISIGAEGGGNGLFGGMLTSFQMACQQIIDYVLMTFVPLLTTTFQTAFGGGMGMGGMGMMGGGIGGAGIGGGVGGMGMGMDGMSGGIFGGLFMNFQMTCQMMVDYILSSFLPMLTEALLTFVDMLQTDVLDVITENVIAFLDLMTEEVITPFLDSTLELFGEYIEMLNEMLEEEAEYILELSDEISEGICDAIDKIIDKIEDAIDKIEEAIAKLEKFLSMGGERYFSAGSAKNGGIIRHRSEGGFVPHFASGGIVKGKGGYSIEAYANGNFSTADLFYANENGVPELVGTLNGHTAVASGKEITGISNAIYESSSKEVSAMNTMIGYLQKISQKDTSISLDGRELVQAIDARRVRNGFSFT